MSKIITVLLLVILGVYLFKRMAAKRKREDDASEQRPVEDMVKCRTCGVNMPRSEAILSQGRFYCCDEHRRADS